MTLMIELPDDLQERLRREAERRGLPIETCTLQLLERSLPSKDRREAVVELLQSWIDEEDSREQQETGDSLMEALDADRPSSRTLFPPDLRGVTW
ncbi:MAG: hypothetical protein WD066_12965 [Planctomycetaceae bacterium]